MDRIGKVYYNETLAGKISQINGLFFFQYDESYLQSGVPISFNLPLKKESYKSENLFPFFENLLSEGWLKHLQSQTQKIDENDKFGLLLSNGKDLIGAVTVIGAQDV